MRYTRQPQINAQAQAAGAFVLDLAFNARVPINSITRAGIINAGWATKNTAALVVVDSGASNNNANSISFGSGFNYSGPFAGGVLFRQNASGSAAYDSILHKIDNGSIPGYLFFGEYPSGGPYFQFQDAGGTTYTTPDNFASVSTTAYEFWSWCVDGVNLSLYRNGGLYSSVACAAFPGPNTSPLKLGARSGANGVSASVALVFMGHGNVSAAQHASWSANPWQIYQSPTRRALFAPSAAGGDVSAALAGQSATASVGTLAPSNTHALTGQSGTASAGTMITGDADAISGQAATTSAGTTSPSISIGLTGQSATSSAGTMTTGSAVQAALTGQAATMSGGTLSPAIATALTGAQGVVSAGTLTATPTFGITGQSAATASGSVTPSTALPLAGSAATAAQGTLLVVGDLTVALTGQAATMAQGDMLLQQLIGAGRITPRRKFQVETSRGIIEVDTLDEVAQIARVEKRTPRAPAVAVTLEGVNVATPSLKPTIDYNAIEQRMRAAVQAEIDDEEELLMMLL